MTRTACSIKSPRIKTASKTGTLAKVPSLLFEIEVCHPIHPILVNVDRRGSNSLAQGYGLQWCEERPDKSGLQFLNARHRCMLVTDASSPTTGQSSWQHAGLCKSVAAGVCLRIGESSTLRIPILSMSLDRWCAVNSMLDKPG